MLCLAPIFSIDGQQLLCKAQPFFFAPSFFYFLFSQEKKEQKQEWNKMTSVFVLWQVYQKLFLLRKVSLFQNILDFTFIHTRPVSKPFSTPQAFILDYIHCYTKRHGNKGDCYGQLHCMYNILYRETKHHFTHKQQQWMIQIHTQYNNIESMLKDSEDKPTLVKA